MITKGMHIAAKGMQTLIEMNDTIANNLANVNTAGFKKANLAFRNVYDAMMIEKSNSENIKNSDLRDIGTLSMGPKTDKLLLEFSQGNLERTGNPFDIAIQGDGFFKVENLEGEINYTRNGSLTINNENMLVTKDGEYILDEQNRHIKLDVKKMGLENINDLIVLENGQICTNDKENPMTLQKIAVVDFRIKSDLKSLGNSKFTPENPTENPEVPAEKFSVQQYALESSNANTISEMINIINVSRSYEALSKLVKNDSDLLNRAINLGRLTS